MIAQNELDGLMEANWAMEYDSDTSNDEPMDCNRNEDVKWGDEHPEEHELSQIDSGSNLIMPRQLRVTFSSLCAKITEAFLHWMLLQNLLGLQRNGVVERSGDGCIHGWIVTSWNLITVAMSNHFFIRLKHIRLTTAKPR